MIESKTIGEIAGEVLKTLEGDVFETFTDECNMDVVEYRLVEDALSLFSYYDKAFWTEFKNEIPEEPGFYWITVITEREERKVTLINWYGKNSFRYWKSKFKYLVAWKICIFPEPYISK